MVTSPEPLFAVEIDRDGTSLTLHLRGELDPHTAPDLRAEVDAAVDDDTTLVVFDLRALDFLDSSGLRVILATHRRVTEQGGRFVLRSPSPSTSRILEITGLPDLLEIEP